MRKIFLSIIFVFLSSLMIIQTADARSFAGRGFGGMSRAKYSNYRNTNSKVFNNSQRQNRFRGALTGLLIGSMLGSLFFSHGLGSALFSWIFLAFIAYFIFNFLRRRNISRFKE